MKYGITGASGTLGRLTTEALFARVPAADVVLITRDPSKLADAAGRGADVRAGDFSDPGSLDFSGIDRRLTCLNCIHFFRLIVFDRRRSQPTCFSAARRAAVRTP